VSVPAASTTTAVVVDVADLQCQQVHMCTATAQSAIKTNKFFAHDKTDDKDSKRIHQNHELIRNLTDGQCSTC